MAKQNREDLKEHFEEFDEPTEAQFAEFIDSDVNITDDIENGTDKATPIDADKLSLWDSVASALKTLTWANLKAVLKTYFDSLYVRLTTNQTVAGVKTFSSFPVTPSAAPTTDYQTANKKYVDDNGGGSEFQIYDLRFWIDVSSTVNWFGIYYSSFEEYSRNCNVANTDSMVTVPDGNLNVLRPTGIAIGNQTVVSFDLWFSGKTSAVITHLSIIKARLSFAGSITAIAVLYEQAVSFDADGYLSLAAVDFTATAISDKDIIYISLGANTTNDISPCFYRLKCSID